MSDRFKLHGNYGTARFRIGAKVQCRVRGELTIVGITDARIPWPLATVGRATKSLVVHGDLVRAIRRESVLAICYWFGVHPVTVWKWRKALGVPEWNYGTRKLWEANFAAGSHLNGVKAGIAKVRDPVRCSKLAAKHRGKHKPAGGRWKFSEDELVRSVAVGPRPPVGGIYKFSESIPHPTLDSHR